ncbi:hypothetical protein GO986_00055 [Deinococcus sp. HMF7620]|uniref:Uncharacterized protein n=1 Tax=Deinococcus arboris TaxID=2682977 RepID=A0A7C9MP10_9DEIO|nr:hypothetical protein [Deinococcus arboris]MVN85164.1 hypothetical protein [Deinococcus arboris]
MSEHPDLTPYLHGLNPDPAAMTDARAFALMLPEAPRLGARLEDLIMCFAYFVQQHTGPRLPGGHTEALNTFRFAVSGLYALLEDDRGGQVDAFATMARAQLWAADKCRQAAIDLSAEDARGASAHDLEGFVIENVGLVRLWHDCPSGLHAWTVQQEDLGRVMEAGRLAAWWVVSRLLETALTLEDGDAETMTAQILQGFERPWPGRTVRADPLATDLPFPDPLPRMGKDPVYTVDYVEVLGGGRVRLCMGGGEDYEATREGSTLTPLPDGAGFLLLTVEGEPMTVRLTPEDRQTVGQVFGWADGEGGQASPLN